MQLLRFKVRHPDGRTEALELETERVLVGSAAHCDIRLPVGTAAPEHVAITATVQGVRAEARHFDPPPTVNGSPFTETQLLPDSTLGIGAAAIRVAVQELDGGLDVKAAKGGGVSPITAVSLLLAIIAGVMFYFKPDSRARGVVAPAEVPALWGDPVTQCETQAPPQALVMAQRHQSVAESRAERHPFSPGDGVSAVVLYEKAAACYKVGGDVGRAEASTAWAKHLRAQIDEEYRTLRARLEHALNVGDEKLALQHARNILDLTGDQEGPYVAWVKAEERRLSLMFGRR
jgi:hypothetical protein